MTAWTSAREMPAAGAVSKAEPPPELLAAISVDDIGSAIAQHVELQVGARQSDRPSAVAALPPGTRAVYTTWLVDLEVNNGGFNQFFFNPYGEFAGLALAGYELLGAEDYAAIMRAAMYAAADNRPDRAQRLLHGRTPADIPCGNCERCEVRCALGLDIRSAACDLLPLLPVTMAAERRA